MTTGIEVRIDDTLVVEGGRRAVSIGPSWGAKRPIPEGVRRGLEPYLEPPGPARAEPDGAGGPATEAPPP